MFCLQNLKENRFLNVLGSYGHAPGVTPTCSRLSAKNWCVCYRLSLKLVPFEWSRENKHFSCIDLKNEYFTFRGGLSVWWRQSFEFQYNRTYFYNSWTNNHEMTKTWTLMLFVALNPKIILFLIKIKCLQPFSPFLTKTAFSRILKDTKTTIA